MLGEFCLLQADKLELVLHTASEPFFIFEAFKFNSNKEMKEFIIRNNVLDDSIRVPGFNIIICCRGSLVFGVSERPYMGGKETKSIQLLLNPVLNFYLTTKILKNERYFQRWQYK
jgi:hypothetical protein